jgi:hypothetical protein
MKSCNVAIESKSRKVAEGRTYNDAQYCMQIVPPFRSRIKGFLKKPCDLNFAFKGIVSKRFVVWVRTPTF